MSLYYLILWNQVDSLQKHFKKDYVHLRLWTRFYGTVYVDLKYDGRVITHAVRLIEGENQNVSCHILPLLQVILQAGTTSPSSSSSSWSSSSSSSSCSCGVDGKEHYVTVVFKSWNIILVSPHIPRTAICWILPSVRRELMYVTW